MKHQKLPKFLALTICLELIVSPLAMAQQQKPTGMQTAMGVLQTGVGIYNNIKGNQNSSYIATDMQNFQKQQTPSPDKYFTVNNMQKIPGLMEYIAKKNMDAAASGGKAINPLSLNCQTLPTTLFESNTEVCRNKTVSNLVDPNQQRAQADEAFAYYNQYLQIDKLYANYSTRSNAGGQPYGTGCMEDAMEVLKGFFSYRLEQLDTMVTEFEAAEARFEAQSEMDLKAIRESTAILGGEGSKFANEFKNSDIFNYGDRFADPACNSIMAKADIDGLGKEGGGLLAIEKKMKADFTAVPEGSKYSPESYIKNNSAIVSDIQKMATKVATQANLNFSQIASGQEGYSAFLNGLSSSVTSDTGVNVGLNSSFFSDIQTKFTQTRNTLNNSMSVLNSELGAKGGNALGLVSNIDNDSNFEAQVKSLENSIKNECLSNSGIDLALSRVYEPTLSKQASKHSANEITKRLKVILTDPNLTPESKISQLEALNASGGARFEVRLDADFETKVIKADGTVGVKKALAAGTTTPSSFFTSLIQNCDTQFQVNKLGNQLSGKEAVKQLRTLKEDYKKAARQNAQDIKDEINKKMIECNGNAEVASSTTVGSCSPATLNMSSPSFCTKAAFSCSSNMKSCTDKAQKVVKDLKDDRLKRTNNFNNNVENNRKQLVAMFDTALGKYMKEAESLRGMFGVGFTSPKDIQRDIKDGSQFDNKFAQNGSDSLEIKDPKKYLEMIKGNMANLRAQVENQQKGIIGGDGNLQKHIDQTKENYKSQVLAKASKLANDCLAAYNSYTRMVSQQKEQYEKAQGELGEKSTEFCNRYAGIATNPIAGCKDDLSNVSNAMINAAMKAGNSATSQEAKRMRDDMARVCAQPGNQRDEKGNSTTSYARVCSLASSGDEDAIEVLTSHGASKNPTVEWKQVCDKIDTGSETFCKPSTAGSTTTSGTKADCSSVENRIASDYEVKLQRSTSGNKKDNSIASLGDTGSFCNASNNSGGNPKGNMGGGPMGSMLGGMLNQIQRSE